MSPDPSTQPQSLRKLSGWVADGHAVSRKFLRAALPGILTILSVAALAIILVVQSAQPPGSDLSPPVSPAQFAAPAGGLFLTAIAGVAFLLATARRSRRLFTELLEQGEIALAQTQAMTAATHDAVLVLDENGRLKTVNPATEKIFHIPAATLVGQHVSMIIPDRALLQNPTDLPRTLAAVGQRPGAPNFPIAIGLSELTIEGRRHFVAMVRDTSESERSGETLRHIATGVAPRAGAEGTRALLQQVSRALATKRAFLVELLGEGPAAVAMRTVAENGELGGTSAMDLRNTACAEVIGKGFRFIGSGASQQYPEDEMLTDHSATGFAGVPLVDHRGRVLGAIGVLREQPLENEAVVESTLKIFASRASAEIERKRTEEALGAEKERLAVTLRSIGDACVTLDNDGRIVMFNAVAERFTGLVHEDVAGKFVNDVLHLVDERTRRRSNHLLQRIVTHGTADAPNSLHLLISHDAQERTVESSSAPIRDRLGRKLGAIIVLRDVTERLRAEEERMKAEKLESLGLVAGGIAHDFNNVLTGILGNVTLALSNDTLPPALAEQLGAARKASQRAQELAGQLLTFAKGGAPVKCATHLGQLLADTTRCAVAGSRTTCDTTIAEDLWPVEVDPGQLAQVIANITVNADQAMPAGGNIHVVAENITLPLETNSPALPAGRWVRFSIEDHGVGIPEDSLAKIFDPYFTTKPTGSGLGLAAAYSIVKNHGGLIVVESKPAIGSTFAVYLPASEKAVEINVAPPPSGPAPAGKGRVLILDDEEVICTLVTCALEPLGYEVTETQDGAVALEKYEEAMKSGRKFDLVISDLTMPGRMSGQEAIRRLRELDPEVRAIVSSGYANDPVMSRHQEFGFCGMIAKPYAIDALGRKVAEVLAPASAPRVIYHSFEARKTA